jgi:hypothetical protein
VNEFRVGSRGFQNFCGDRRAGTSLKSSGCDLNPWILFDVGINGHDEERVLNGVANQDSIKWITV